jgi:hypothetical protein
MIRSKCYGLLTGFEPAPEIELAKDITPESQWLLTVSPVVLLVDDHIATEYNIRTLRIVLVAVKQPKHSALTTRPDLGDVSLLNSALNFE